LHKAKHATKSKKKCQMPKHRARSCRSSRHGLGIGKEKIGSEVNISGLGCGRAVRGRIVPAIDDVLSPPAGSEKANTPHQSTPMNRKRKGWHHGPEFQSFSNEASIM
jgi:hypothetical protein